MPQLTVRLELEKALSKSLTFIGGTEDFLRRRTLSELLEGAGVGPEDFDFELVNADEKTPTEWIGSASTSPFMGEKRTLVVRQVLRTDPRGDASLSKMLAGVPPTARLILVADEEAGDDSKQKRLQTIHQAWADLVKKLDGYVFLGKAEPREVAQMVRDEAKVYDKTMSLPAANVLVEITGGSLSRAFEEVEKLAFFVGDRDTIKEADIRLVATPSREWSVYKMVDAAIAGSTGEAIRQLRILVGGNTKAEEAAQKYIFPTMSRQFKLIWQARLVIDLGGYEQAKDLFPARPNLGSEQQWGRDRAARNARTLSLDQIQKCFELLADTDARLKGSLPAFSAMESLESLLLAIVDVVQRRNAA